jgi:hypothetical protein
MWKVSIIFVAALSLVACSKSGDAGGGGGGGGGAGTTLTLAKLNNLKVVAPEGSKVSDAPIGNGVMIQGPNLGVTIEEASDTTPKDIKAAKEDAEMFSPKNMKEEKLADGWALTFENKGGMGTNFFVKVRREIGGKSYWCETTCSLVPQQAAALAACKSLKP